MDKVVDELRVRSLIVVDEDDQPRVRVHADSQLCGVQLMASDGTVKLDMQTFDGESTNLTIWDDGHQSISVGVNRESRGISISVSGRSVVSVGCETAGQRGPFRANQGYLVIDDQDSDQAHFFPDPL